MAAKRIWWLEHPELAINLERDSMMIDPSILRLSPREIFRERVLRERVAGSVLDATPLLVYRSYADTHDGRVGLAAVFTSSPFASLDPIASEALTMKGWRPQEEPSVFALNGPTRSPHRHPEKVLGNPKPEAGGCHELCLYFYGDHAEMRWRSSLGVIALFDMAARHLEAEHVWRSGKPWPLPEAPHGETAAAPRNKRLRVLPDEVLRAA